MESEKIAATMAPMIESNSALTMMQEATTLAAGATETQIQQISGTISL